MRKFYLLSLLIIFVFNAKAQKSTEELVMYSYTIQPDINLKSLNLRYSFESPFKSIIQTQLDKDKKPTLKPKEGGGYTSIPPTPTDIVQDFMKVFYLSYDDKDNTRPIFVKLKLLHL